MGDERLLIPAIKKDPAAVIIAFIYVKSNAQAKGLATSMRNKFSDDYSVTGEIPVIGIDDTKPFGSSGPFFADGEPSPPPSPRPPSPTPPSPSPPSPSSAASCDQHPACAKAGMTGDCCPTQEGMKLGCCNGQVDAILI